MDTEVFRGYVDVHSHILPCIDDGAQSIEEAIKMLEASYNSGVRAVIATPHYKVSKHNFIKPEEYEEAFKIIQGYVQENLPEMSIFPGNEIFYTESIHEALLAGSCRTLAQSSYILVEFYPGESYSGISNSLHRFLSEGYRPILAHAERYENLRKDRRIEALIHRGIYIQVNASSVMGEHGWHIKRYARSLLKRDVVHFIASDCHGLEKRTPNLTACIQYLEKSYSPGYINLLLTQNPLAVLNNDYI